MVGFLFLLGFARAMTVLVPGTGNSLIPQYFSPAIQEELARHGESVWTVSGLAPFGDLRANGERVLEDILEHSTGEEPITLVGHSAGGLYALYAVHLARARGLSIRFERVVTVASPLRGAPLADLLVEPRAVELLVRAIAWITPGFFDLRGLVEMTEARVQAFTDRLTLPEGLPVTAIGAQQEKTLNPFQGFNSHFLNPFLALADGLVAGEGGPGDGLVPLSSALGEGVRLRGVNFEPRYDWIVPLDHQEVVHDRRVLRALGFHKTTWVEAEQRKLFAAIARLISQSRVARHLER